MDKLTSEVLSLLNKYGITENDIRSSEYGIDQYYFNSPRKTEQSKFKKEFKSLLFKQSLKSILSIDFGKSKGVKYEKTDWFTGMWDDFQSEIYCINLDEEYDIQINFIYRKWGGIYSSHYYKCIINLKNSQERAQVIY